MSKSFEELEAVLAGVTPHEFAWFLKKYRAKYGKNSNIITGFDDYLDDSLGLAPLAPEVGG